MEGGVREVGKGVMPVIKKSFVLEKWFNLLKLMISCRVDDVEGIESLRWEDQQKIRKYVDSNVLPSNSVAIASAPVANGIELSQTSRATCKRCSQKITKGEAQDVNFAMEASRKSRTAFEVANVKMDKGDSKEVMTSIKRALDFNFHDVHRLLRLVRVAKEAISR